MTNRSFANFNDPFIKLCEMAGTPSTKRQASKFRNKRGKAWDALRLVAIKREMSPNEFYGLLEQGKVTV